MARILAHSVAMLALLAAAPVGSAVPAPPTAEQAPIALMIDLSSGQTLYSREADRRFIPASITKVMTVFLAFEMMEQGRLHPRQVFTMSDRIYDDWYRTGSTMFLDRDSTATVEELLMGITTVSANDGAAMLAEGAAGSLDRWIAMMNTKAREVGMANSYFGSVNGWPDGGKTFVTAEDLALLARELILRHPEKYRKYFGHRGLRTNGFAQANHDPITGVIEGADGIKTGFTNQAGPGFLGTAIRDGRRLVMVIGAAESGNVRRDASRAFMEWGFSAFSSLQLFETGGMVGLTRVQDGMADSVALRAPQPIHAAFPTGQERPVTLRVIYDGPLRAPIQAGERVAELEIAVEGLPAARVPLEAAQAVPQATILRRLRNGLVGLFR